MKTKKETREKAEYAEVLRGMLLDTVTQKPYAKKSQTELGINEAQMIVAIRVVAKLLEVEL